MKKFFGILGFITLITFGAVISAQATPMVKLYVQDIEVLLGETFDIQVWADGDGLGKALLAFGFDVTPGAELTYNSYTIGAGFEDLQSFFPPPPFPEVSGVAKGYSLTDDVLLATLSFTSLADDPDLLSHPCVLGLYDGIFYGLYYEADPPAFVTGYDINTQGTAPVPEPSTSLLLLLGLAGMAGLKKRFS